MTEIISQSGWVRELGNYFRLRFPSKAVDVSAIIGFVIENTGGDPPTEPVVDDQNDWLSNGDPDLSDAEDVEQPRDPAEPVQPQLGRSFKVAKLEICFCADRYQLINDEQMIVLEDGDRIELATHSLRVELHYPQPVALAPRLSLFEAPLAAPVPVVPGSNPSPLNGNAAPMLPNFGQYANTDPLGFLYGSAGGANQLPSNQHAMLPNNSSNNSRDYPQPISSYFSAPVVAPQRAQNLIPERAPTQSG